MSKRDPLAQGPAGVGPARPSKYTVEQMTAICANLDRAFAMGWRMVPPQLTPEMAAISMQADIGTPSAIDYAVATAADALQPCDDPHISLMRKQRVARAALRWRLQLQQAPKIGGGR